jgi:hypothetical protein
MAPSPFDTEESLCEIAFEWIVCASIDESASSSITVGSSSGGAHGAAGW